MTDKQNFEKDINVPSKEIEYKEDAKDCELAKGGGCCYCKNIACYQLEEQLKAELKSAKELREYTYDCCKQAGEELAKNSFEWDGKEKNLVVQAMELNERYDQLKKANDEKNELLAQLGCPTVGTARRLTLSLKEQLEAYKMEAEEGKEINAELKAENEGLKNAVMQKCPQCGEVYLNPIGAKLYNTLAEIKEIAESVTGCGSKCETCEADGYCADCEDEILKQILQKIIEVER